MTRRVVARPTSQSRVVHEDCPVDHEGAERVVNTLPGAMRRGVYFSVGALSVVFGVIGIFVPLWPTTCFLLLAGWCFARSSRRAERWLHENRLFGRYLSGYRDRGVISARVCACSISWVYAQRITRIASRGWWRWCCCCSRSWDAVRRSSQLAHG